MKSKAYLLCIFIFITISGCDKARSNLSCQKLLSQSTYEDINTTLSISAPRHANTFQFDDLILLDVRNNSKFQIEILPDQDLRVFIWQENSWIQVKNGVNYLSAVDRISPESEDTLGGTAYTIAVPVSEQSGPVRLCIILEARNDPDHSRTRIAAYTEVTLNP